MSDPVAPVQESPPAGPAPLPLHRVASTALVAGLFAGPLGALAECGTAWALFDPTPGWLDTSFVVLCVPVLGACTAAFMACVALTLRLRPLLRLPALALAGSVAFPFGAAVAGWLDGLSRGGGPEAALRSMMRMLGEMAADSHAVRLLFAPIALFLTGGVLRAGLVPRLGWPPRARWLALAGALGGAGFSLIVLDRDDGRDRTMAVTFVATGVALGLALGLADRLEPRLAAALRRRAVGD